MAEGSPYIAYDLPTQSAVYAHAGNLHRMIEFISSGKQMIQGGNAYAAKLLTRLVA
jgi:hypothetical protein